MQYEDSTILELRVESLSTDDSPRLAGCDDEHAKLLAQAMGPLPPICVQRETGRVIDGMHRLQAARLRGQETIAAVLYDGDAESAFILAVEANSIHGMPLTRADRKAAVARILLSRPQWSDRKIAKVVGLSAESVAGVRGITPGGMATLWIGSDGKTRPLDASHRRAEAAKLIVVQPTSSLRQVADRIGISPETARTARSRLSGYGGEQTATVLPHPTRERADAGDPRANLQSLLRDPAFRSSTSGRPSGRAHRGHPQPRPGNVPECGTGQRGTLAQTRRSGRAERAAFLCRLKGSDAYLGSGPVAPRPGQTAVMWAGERAAPRSRPLWWCKATS